MRSPASIRTWGPSFSFALLVALVAFGAAGWTWHTNRGPVEPAAVVTVTALKPVTAGGDAAARPVELAFGVPSERTVHLWWPFWPPAR